MDGGAKTAAGAGSFLWRAFGRAELPEELAEETEPVVQVRRGKCEMADEAANLCLHGGLGGAMRKALEGERFEEEGDEAFFFSGGGEGGFGGGRFWILWTGLANELVENDGDGLAEVHGGVVGLGGNTEQEVAVAEVVIGEADFFRSEEDGDVGTVAEVGLDDCGGGFEGRDWLQQIALSAGGADDQGAVGDGLGELLELFGCSEDGLSIDGGLRLLKGDGVRMHYAQVGEAEVGHGAGGRANVEGVAAVDQDYVEAGLFCGCEHRGTVYGSGLA
jgi:hypothetical protein